MQTILIIKLIFMLTFFSEVVIFGKFISGLKCFNKGQIMSTAMTFSGSLFLSIAFLDIIPQAIASFDMYFAEVKTSLSSSSNLHSNIYPPLTMIIACITFMIIMYIDKIMIGHSHDHQYEVSFMKEPRKSQRDVEAIQMKQCVNLNERNFQKDIRCEEKVQQITSGYNHRIQGTIRRQKKQQKKDQTNYRPFILQAGMAIHAYFQCLAVGLQKTSIGVLSLSSAIIVHKWAEGLTLGLIYRKQGYSDKTSTIMVIIQGMINVLGLVSGASLIGQGNFVMAFFMSISAGTFLYISLLEVLFEQIQTMSKIKMMTILLANLLIGLLVELQRYSEGIVQNNQS